MKRHEPPSCFGIYSVLFPNIYRRNGERQASQGLTNAPPPEIRLQQRISGAVAKVYQDLVRRRRTASTAPVAFTSGVSGGALAPALSNSSRTPA